MLIDSHAHIQGSEFSADVDQVIRRASEAGVEKIIIVGGAGDLSSNEAGLRLARSFPGLFATVGMHPHDAKDVGEEEWDKLRALVREPGVVAVGETGLDFYYEHAPRQTQVELFSRFIGIARETGLPLVVHSRRSDREVAELLCGEAKGSVGGVIHCFTGDYDAAREFLDLGFFLSFSGIVTFKNAEYLRDVVRKVPLDRILVETDAPYLAPVPHRGKRNEPAFLRLVADVVAGVKGISLEEVARSTSCNAQTLFGI
ncbi:MAG: TatD family hydrolase [Deltaproteobacteria bacterium]|nr:TatD family hydrolase [Deltaproteobacteria bacterium]